MLTDDEMLAIASACVVVDRHTPEDLGIEARMLAHLRVGLHDVLAAASLPASLREAF